MSYKLSDEMLAELQEMMNDSSKKEPITTITGEMFPNQSNGIPDIGETITVSGDMNKETGEMTDLTIESNDTKREKRIVPPLVVDRELLAMCNLSNLRLEFGNFKKGSRAEATVEDHTIYSFIDQEYNSIIKNIPEDRTMFDLENDKNPENPTVPLYKSIDELKRYSGITMEYYEKGKIGNKEADFLKKWKPLYAADGLKLVQDYLNFCNSFFDNRETVEMRGSLLQFLDLAYDGDLELIEKKLSQIVDFYEPKHTDPYEKDAFIVRGLDIIVKPILFEMHFFDGNDYRTGFFKITRGEMPLLLPKDIEAELTEKLLDIAEKDQMKVKLEIPKRKSIVDGIKEAMKAENKANAWGIGITLLFSGLSGWKIAGQAIQTSAIISTTPVEVKKFRKGILIKIGEKSVYTKANRATKEFLKTIEDLWGQWDELIKLAPSDLEKKFVEQIKAATNVLTGNKKPSIIVNRSVIENSRLTDKTVAKAIDNAVKNSGPKIKNAQKKLFINIFNTVDDNIVIKGIMENLNISIEALIEELFGDTSGFMKKAGKLLETSADNIALDLAGKVASSWLQIVNALNEISAEEAFENNDTPIEELEGKGEKEKLLALFHKCNYFKEFSNEVFRRNVDYTETMLDDIEKSIIMLATKEETVKKIKERIKRCRSMLSELKLNNDIFSSLSEYPFDYFDFRISLFRNDDTKVLALCFNGKSKYSQMKNDMEKRNFRNLFLLLETVRNYLINYLIIKDPTLEGYTLQVTGNDMGADVADIYHLATNVPTTVFRTQGGNFSNTIRMFNAATLASVFNLEYYTQSQMQMKVLGEFLKMATFEIGYGAIGNIMGFDMKCASKKVAAIIGTALLTKIGLSLFWGGVLTPIMITFIFYIKEVRDNEKKNEYYDFFYIQLCRMGFLDCSHCNRLQSKITSVCKVLNKEVEKEPPLVSEDAIKEILKEEFIIDGNSHREESFFNIYVDKKEITNSVVTGETYLNILTEFFEFFLDHNDLYKLHEEIDKENNKIGVVYGKHIATIYKALDSKEEFINKIYYNVSRYDLSLANNLAIYFGKNMGTYQKRYENLRCEIIKDTYLKLEENSVGISTLKKKFYYKCKLSGAEEVREKIIITSNKEFDDLSLGKYRVIFLQIISFIRSIQSAQDIIQNSGEEQNYLVYAFGIPQYGNHKHTTTSSILYAKNLLLLPHEIKELGIYKKTSHYISTDATYIEKSDVELWNEKYNKNILTESAYATATEFVFFPFINSKTGMIADRNLFCDCAVEEKEQVPPPSGNISKYFSESDTIVSATGKSLGIANFPNEAEKKNIIYAARRLDEFREVIGVPFIVTSWFRCKALNDAVGGSRTSAHRYGLAIDVYSNKMKAKEIYNKARSLVKSKQLSIDQLIYYSKSGFVHFGFRLSKKDERQSCWTTLG